VTARRSTSQGDVIQEIASILATAIMRLRLRDVHNLLIKNGKSENGLEVSSGKSVHPVEPERGRKK